MGPGAQGCALPTFPASAASLPPAPPPGLHFYALTANYQNQIQSKQPTAKDLNKNKITRNMSSNPGGEITVLRKLEHTDERNLRQQKQWKHTLCLWSHTAKGIPHPKPIWRFDVIPIKIPTEFFKEPDNNLKCVWKHKGA